MTTLEQLKLVIGNAVFELWASFPEPKKSYTKYYQEIDMAIDNWHPPKTEKKINEKRS